MDKKLLYAGIAVAVLLVAVGVYFLMRKKSDKSAVVAVGPKGKGIFLKSPLGVLALQDGSPILLNSTTPVFLEQVSIDNADNYMAIKTTDGQYIGVDPTSVLPGQVIIKTSKTFNVGVDSGIVTLVVDTTNNYVRLISKSNPAVILRYSLGSAADNINGFYFDLPTNYVNQPNPDPLVTVEFVD